MSRGFFVPVHPVMGGRAGAAARLAGAFPVVRTSVRSPTLIRTGVGGSNPQIGKHMNTLTVLTSEIRLHDGLYSLNDLHQASGGVRKHQPSNFMRLDTAQELMAEIRSSDLSIIPAKTITGRGKAQGTYVCRELVYAYAMWISPKFHLAVIRAFDGQHNAAITPISAIHRWMLSTDYTGQRQIHPIPNDAYILTPSTMLRILVSPGDCLEVTDAQLAEFIGAASNRLRQRIIKREQSVNALRAGVQ